MIGAIPPIEPTRRPSPAVLDKYLEIFLREIVYNVVLPTIKQCEYCGADFTAATKAKKYCSDKCRREADKKHKREVYIASHPEAHNGEGAAVCKFCGKQFIAIKHSRGATTQFCSNACRKKYQRQQSLGLYKEVESVCKICGSKFLTTHPKMNTCSERCRRIANNRSSLKRFAPEKIIDKDINVRDLFLRDNGVCYICGELCDFNDYIVNSDGRMICGNRYPSIDHVIPAAKLGEHSWGNVKLAHRLCNSIKQDKV